MLHKIQTIVDHFKNRFKEIATPETLQAIDKMIVPFKGKHEAQMYMPKKPNKWDYKLWCREGISVFECDFEVVGGYGTTDTPANIQSTHTFGESENVFSA